MKTMRIAALSTLFLAVGTGVALADRPGPDWMPLDALIKAVETQGYRVTEAEADDGRWEGEAMKDGKYFEFAADPRTGQILHVEPEY